MRVVGTAGHVDHGKSTLVRALTGMDPDRLREEKARGMTIDLGFAWVDLHLPAAASTSASATADRGEHAQGRTEEGRKEEGRKETVGLVDVPGHIDFIKNMLAGVGGIDAALLVIAADEGVMPQTREHLAILDLLAAPACVVALTKVDVVDEPEWLDLVELDIVELLEGTRYGAQDKFGAQETGADIAQPASIVRVSAQSGAGLDELRARLAEVLGTLAPRRNRNRPRLPVDRAFTLSGFGAVATGTLLDGEFRTGQDVVIYPEARRARIRGMQSHKQQVEQAQPGSRIALNLAGVTAAEIHRGDVVAWPNTLEPTSLIDVEFRILPHVSRPLRHNQMFDLFCGASERRATVRLLGTERLEPGARGWLQLRLDRPLLAVAGDRYILRRPSPSETIGGGRILHTEPRRRWRRFDAAVLARFEQLAQGAPDELLLAGVQQVPFSNASELIERATLDVETGEAALAQLVRDGAVLTFDIGNAPVFLALATEETLRARVLARLARYHAAHPLRRGMPQGEIRTELSTATGVHVGPRLVAVVLSYWQEQDVLRVEASSVALADHAPTPTDAQQQRMQALMAEFAARPNTPPTEADALGILGDDGELLSHLVETGALLSLNQGVLMTPEAFADQTAAIVELAQKQGEVTLADVRDRLDTSRRYAQAILEELDTRRITRRTGDVRTLRAEGSAASVSPTARDGPA